MLLPFSAGNTWVELLLTFDNVLPGKASLRLGSEKQADRVGDVAVGLGWYLRYNAREK